MPKLFEECSLKSARSELRHVGIDDTYFDSGLRASNSDGFGEIRVVADDHRGVAAVLECVKE